MKQFRVTLKYIINDHTLSLSTVIPAYNENSAISRCIEANNITSVVEQKADVLNN
jgi:hypothetical protein